MYIWDKWKIYSYFTIKPLSFKSLLLSIHSAGLSNHLANKTETSRKHQHELKWKKKWSFSKHGSVVHNFLRFANVLSANVWTKKLKLGIKPQFINTNVCAKFQPMFLHIIIWFYDFRHFLTGNSESKESKI